MATNLPPPPTGSTPGSFAWQDWYFKLNQYLSTNGTIAWANIDKSGSNLSDIAIRNHDSLQSLQGGTTGEHYHLTSAQASKVAALQSAYASGGAAPAGGVGTAAGGWDTAVHRDAAITLLNNIRLALIANGIMS